MFVELHMIQNFAPSCLNRDDTNTPKDCEFGGHRRARISSQCIKRSVRWHPTFAETLGYKPSLRTRRAKAELGARLRKRGLTDEHLDPILDAFMSAALLPAANGLTSVLLFLGRDELDSLEAVIVSNWEKLSAAADALLATSTDDEKARTKALERLSSLCVDMVKGLPSGTKAADIALFGRMIAERQKDEVDAACQVAHAFSTHKVLMDMDFYTAVDDLQAAQEEPGAGMMGEVEFNSSCFYRYSLVDTGQLMTNLKDDKDLALRAIEAFIQASVAAIPTGKQNSFAAQNPPAFVSVMVRNNGAPWSLANAFETPVRVYPDDQDSLSDKSIKVFDDYLGRLESAYGNDGIRYKKGVSLSSRVDQLENIELVKTLDELVRGAMEAIRL